MIIDDLQAAIAAAESKHGPLPIHVAPAGRLVQFCAALEELARFETDLGRLWSALAILAEEVGELARAATPEEQRAELVQIAAVAVRWIALLDGVAPDQALVPMDLRADVGRLQSALGGELAARQAVEAEVERLTAERAALLAPVKGVDLDAMSRTVTGWRALAVIPADERTTGHRADIEYLSGCSVLHAEILIREVARLRARLAAAEAERDVAVRTRDFTHGWYATRCQTLQEWARSVGYADYVASVLANDGSPPTYAQCLALAEHRAARAEKERDAARAEAEELRLTLAAEQGRPEGVAND